jgi:hypothetical protein
VRFLVDGKQIDVDRSGASDVFTGSWVTRFSPPGRHVLSARATDAAGHTFSAARNLRVCR